MEAEIFCVLTGFGLSVPLQFRSPFAQAAIIVAKIAILTAPRIANAGVLSSTRSFSNTLMGPLSPSNIYFLGASTIL